MDDGFTLFDALTYAARSWPVLPLHTIRGGYCTCQERGACGSPGKHPIIEGGVHSASTDLAQVTNWFSRWRRANVGVASGPVSGLVVMDIDPRHGGDEEVVRLAQEGKDIPSTTEVITGSGGRHCLFAYPVDGTTIGNRVGLYPGIDIRGAGGYVASPPSLHISGRRYAWDIEHTFEDVGLAPVPDWLLAKLTETPPRTEGGSDDPLYAEVIAHGGRHDTLWRAGRLMRHGGFDYDEILSALALRNHRSCVPPLMDGEVHHAANVAWKFHTPGLDCHCRAKYRTLATTLQPQPPSVSPYAPDDPFAPGDLSEGMWDGLGRVPA